ncbi:hypothetical protein SARC_12401 [Sphaeroforma arctica JP610]|uniref:Uncharacterized protein n=1 Tax=Sphaeroforma arctica JP610 TaxID=667725 RepID=A0A0L0FF47_9EUKA|nr:hypothetical protein SARC_12401 [Sphaeroforma arctica JP610]KNC75066.1 hypothetical protein SARC_12401 [Sphaeroforma arctica JP610]|eukprot:XP_014148968.1 hypothetical protein SARC_12401 [Sphaeroforma arctica JP610]
MESSVSVGDLLGSDTFDRDIKRWTSQCERVLLRLGGRVLGDHKQAETHVIQIAGSYMPDSPVKFRIDYEPRIVALPQLPNELREAVEEEMRACNDDATVSVTVVYTFALGEGDKAKGTLDYVNGEVQRNAFKDLLTYSAEDLISVLNNTEFWN